MSFEYYKTFGEQNSFHSQEKKRIAVLSFGGTFSSVDDPTRGRHVEMTHEGFLADRMRALVRPIEHKIIDLNITTVMARDSSDMVHTEWTQAIREVLERLSTNHGIVILTGTDTASRIGTAITFGLLGRAALSGEKAYLPTPVCIASSQKPLGVYGSDADIQFQNAIGSVIRASDERISEVMMVNSPSQILRACRTTKINDRGFPIFASPNYPPIGTIVAGEGELDGIQFTTYARHINYNEDLLKNSTLLPIQSTFRNGIITIGLNGLSTADEIIEIVKSDSCTAAVLETFGSGNGPFTDAKYSMVRVVREAQMLGKPILLASSILGGIVRDTYEAGRVLAAAGGIGTADMTREAGELKLGWLMDTPEYKYKGLKVAGSRRLLRGIDIIREMFRQNLVGERTEPERRTYYTPALPIAS